jgi:hypothetical protein
VKKTVSVFALSALLLTVCFSAEAQQPKKVVRIGYLSPRDRVSESVRSEAIRLALRELGYIEGQNMSSSTDTSWCISRLISSWQREGT